MSILLLLFIIIYLFLIIANHKKYVSGTNVQIVSLLSMVVSVVMLCSSNAANLDLSVADHHDLSGYRYIYESLDVREHPDFNMYYIFYSCIYLGQTLGLSFDVWWVGMSIFSMLVILYACKVHKFNFNLFMVCFLAYYEIVFYSGLKFYYGFCLFLLAYGFLIRNTRRDRLIFATITCLAGGFHIMYYFFLVFLILPRKKTGKFIRIIVVLSLLLTVYLRISGSALYVLQPFFNLLDNGHISGYTSYKVGLGFYIPVFLQILLTYVCFSVRRFLQRRGEGCEMVDTMYYTVLISILFMPFYSLALTFMRLLTALSLVLVVSCSGISDSKEFRYFYKDKYYLIVLSFILTKMIGGIGGDSFFHNAVVPYFDIF